MLKKYIPFFGWIKHYKVADLKSDLLAGLIVAIMLIPQGMAYAMLAGLSPVTGLYAATIPAIVYALFGTSRHLSVGPVALVSILVFSSVSTLAIPGSNEYLSLVLLLMLMIGLIQFMLGILRLGFLVNFISQPVMSGFISASAIIIGFSQLNHLLGINIQSSHLFSIIKEVFNRLSELNWVVFAIGLTSTLILLLFKKYLPRIPGPLIVVVLGIVIAYFFNLQSFGVKIVGEVPQGLPSISVPFFTMDSVIKLLPTALTISFIGFLESISIGKVIAAKKNYTLEPNKELIGLGLANVIGSFFSSYPVTGSLSRTAVNDDSGAKTQVSSIFTAVFILLTLISFTTLFYYLPQTILGAIIVVAVFGLIDLKEVKYLFSVKTIDGWTWIVTVLATLIIGIEVGIIIGVGFSLIVLISSKGKLNLTELGYLRKTNRYVNLTQHPEAYIESHISILRIDNSLNFANISLMEKKVKDHIKSHSEINIIILDFSSVNSIDTMAVTALENLIYTYDGKVDFYFVKIKRHVREILEKADWEHKFTEYINYLTINQVKNKLNKNV